MMQKCPHCGENCMSSLQKLFLGPASSATCEACGNLVTIRWRHALVLLIPAALALIFMNRLELTPLQILPPGLLLLIIAGLIQLLFIPLSKARS